MVALGDVRKLKSKSDRNLYCLVLANYKSARTARVALITHIDSQNCSQISVGNSLRLYPAIQGTISTDSLETPGLKGELNLNSEIVKMAFGWPSLRPDEKKSIQLDYKSILTLGNANLAFSTEFKDTFEAFSELCHGHLLARQLGVQLHDGFLIRALRSGDTSALPNMNSLNAALYSAPSLGMEIQKSGGSVRSDFVRLAIRRAIDLRSESMALEGKGKKATGEGRYFEFMRQNGIYSMSVGHQDKSDFARPVIRKGPYTLRFETVKVS